MADNSHPSKRTHRSLSAERSEGEEEDYEVTFSSTPSAPNKKLKMAKSPEKTEKSISTAIVNELKNHFDKKSDETQANFREYMAGVEKKVDKNTENIREIKDAIVRLERGSTSSHASNGSFDNVMSEASSGYTSRPDDNSKKRSKYDFSRRSLRVWPVDGENDLDLMKSGLNFIYDVLLVKQSELSVDRIERARRVRSSRIGQTRKEALITFVDASTRDFVISHAKNLQTGRENQHGVRLEYPDFLGDDFRILTKFGAKMRQKMGEGFKRNVKFNDDEMSLYVDVKFPNQDEWLAVTPEVARETCREEDQRKAATVKRIIQANGAGVIENLLATVKNTANGAHPQRNQTKTNYLPPSRERHYNDQGNFVHNPDTFTLR